MSLTGKNIIITGATSGFGVEMVSALTHEGASVFLGGRRENKGQEVAEKHPNATFHVVDVADEASSKAFFEAAKEHFGGPVDYILLNAGVEGNMEEVTVPNVKVETYDYIFGVNVRGIVLGLQHGTSLLRKGGTFLSTSSVGSILPFAGNPVYAASKAAVDSLVRSYAAQFAESSDERIRSLSIYAMNPVLYRTEMSDRFLGDDEEAKEGFAKLFNPSQRVGTAEELAGIVVDFCHDKLPYKSGAAFAVDTDTHFPLEEYFDRIKASTEGITVQSQ